MKNNEYVVYDEEGNLLQLVVLRESEKDLFRKNRVVEKTHLKRQPNNLNCSFELRKKLLSFLSASEDISAYQSLPLPDLIREFVLIHGYTE